MRLNRSFLWSLPLLCAITSAQADVFLGLDLGRDDVTSASHKIARLQGSTSEAPGLSNPNLQALQVSGYPPFLALAVPPEAAWLGFANNTLFSYNLRYSGNATLDALLQALRSQYGQPNVLRELNYTDDYIWTLGNTRIRLRHQSIEGQVSLRYTWLPLLPEVERLMRATPQ